MIIGVHKEIQIYPGKGGLTTGAPKLVNSDLFLEKRATVPIQTVARFTRNKSLLISFGAPVV